MDNILLLLEENEEMQIGDTIADDSENVDVRNLFCLSLLGVSTN